MRGLCKKAKVKPLGLLAIRHLTTSVLSEAGVPVKYIQAVLRHKKLSTTERYLHSLEDLKSALQVLEKKVTWYTWEQKSLLRRDGSSEGR
jgi:site-specific recombinase XerD